VAHAWRTVAFLVPLRDLMPLPFRDKGITKVIYIAVNLCQFHRWQVFDWKMCVETLFSILFQIPATFLSPTQVTEGSQ
jgi:hypothetical protein